MLPIVLNKHDGGMTNDPRDPQVDRHRNIRHFDDYSNSMKLTPYRDMVVDASVESSFNTFQITKMLSANGTLWGFGVVNSGVDGHAQVYTKTTPGDPTSVWTTATNGHDSGSNGGAAGQKLFAVYNGFLYGDNAVGIWKYDYTNQVFTYNDYTSHIPSAQGIVHSKDGNLYVPSGNLILVNNGGWSVGLTLASGVSINTICEYGNYLAIACDNPDGTCFVFLWDRDTSSRNGSDSIAWGFGSLKLIETIGGILCGVSVGAANLTSLVPRVYFKRYMPSYYSPDNVQIIQVFVCTLAIIGTDKQKFNELFYFLAEMTIDGIVFKGLWKMALQPSGNISVSFDILPRNSTALGTGSLLSFFRWGDYVFISYLNPSNSNFTVWRTDSQANYTATSLMETCINPGMSPNDRIQKKKLLSVGALYEPLPAGASVTVKHRTDGGAWITIFTETTTGQVRTEPYTRDVNGQFTDGFEHEFHVESTGGAEISTLIYKYEIIATNS